MRKQIWRKSNSHTVTRWQLLSWSSIWCSCCVVASFLWPFMWSCCLRLFNDSFLLYNNLVAYFSFKTSWHRLCAQVYCVLWGYFVSVPVCQCMFVHAKLCARDSACVFVCEYVCFSFLCVCHLCVTRNTGAWIVKKKKLGSRQRNPAKSDEDKKD